MYAQRFTHPSLPNFISPAPFKLGEGDEAISYARGWWGKASEQEITGLGFAEYVAPEPEPEPQPITESDVIAERERRLALGFDYDFGDERGVHHIGTTPDDMRKWLDEVTPIAQALINAGVPTGEVGIFTETGPVTVTAAEWQQILLAAGNWRQPIYQASFALQAMDPIPADFAHDSYWP